MKKLIGIIAIVFISCNDGQCDNPNECPCLVGTQQIQNSALSLSVQNGLSTYWSDPAKPLVITLQSTDRDCLTLYQDNIVTVAVNDYLKNLLYPTYWTDTTLTFIIYP